jgi:mono/diheme cytochrome c family protein
MKTKRHLALFFALVLLLTLALSACGGSPATEAPPAADAKPAVPAPYAGTTNPVAGDSTAIAAGKALYDQDCASCHGASGKGDGPAAAALDPKPQDLADNAASLGDDYMYWRIAEGGAMAPFNSAMPAWKDILSSDEIWQVIAYVHTLK